MQSVAFKNDKTACLYFVIISPDPYFNFFFGLYLSNHLEYFNNTLQEYTTGQRKVWHAKMTTALPSFSYYLP